MKTTLLFIFLFLTSFLAIADPTKSQFLGHWRHADENLSCDYTFAEDGTFTGNIAQHGTIVWMYAGKWSLAGDTLNYEFTKSSLEQIPVGTTDQDKIIEMTKDYYIIQARDGSRRKYSRVQ
ncbi:MAG TPA: hypothetical protein VIV62_05655 [Chthoniobacterales bacterium]|jgi:hypothetical protein